MATYNKYETAIESLCNKLLDAFGATDTWNAVIHTDAPAAADVILTDLIEIGNSNGYTSGGLSIGFNSTRTAGVVTATAVDVVWTAVTGNLGTSTTGRYVSVYDFTSTAKNLWCNWDYGATFTVAVGETFTLDFSTTFWTMS
jgi:hypothetical protein